MSRHLKNIGDWGEEQACLFLRRQNFEIIDRNYHTTAGEIDVVAKKGMDWYFVEVKTRSAGELANDLSVTAQKKFKLRKTVKQYCYKKAIADSGIVLASLMVVYDKITRKVNFRLAVMID